MLELVIFHSGNSASLSYRKVRVVTEAVQKKFGDQLGLKIDTTESELAKSYNCRGSLAVFVNQKLVDLEVATSKEMMEDYLKEKLSCSLDNRWTKVTGDDLTIE